MGLDMQLVQARNRKILEGDNFWRVCIDATNIEDFEYNKTAVVCYWRKFWDLHTFISNKKGRLDNGEWCEITREDLEDMIEFTTHNKDYWDSFKSVPQLCEILYNYNKIRKNGFNLYYEGDY